MSQVIDQAASYSPSPQRVGWRRPVTDSAITHIENGDDTGESRASSSVEWASDSWTHVVPGRGEEHTVSDGGRVVREPGSSAVRRSNGWCPPRHRVIHLSGSVSRNAKLPDFTQNRPSELGKQSSTLSLLPDRCPLREVSHRWRRSIWEGPDHPRA